MDDAYDFCLIPAEWLILTLIQMLFMLYYYCISLFNLKLNQGMSACLSKCIIMAMMAMMAMINEP
jgi:hypothetical protein